MPDGVRSAGKPAIRRGLKPDALNLGRQLRDRRDSRISVAGLLDRFRIYVTPRREDADMTRTTWEAQEQPLLAALAAGEFLSTLPKYRAWAEAHGLDGAEATDMLGDLANEGYVSCRMMGAWGATVIRIDDLKLAPRGRRHIGLWPDDDATAARFTDALLDELRGIVDDDSVDGEQRSKVRAVLVGVAGMGKETLIQIVAAAATKAAGLS